MPKIIFFDNIDNYYKNGIYDVDINTASYYIYNNKAKEYEGTTKNKVNLVPKIKNDNKPTKTAKVEQVEENIESDND